MRDCDSVEGDHITRVGSRHNTSITSSSGEMGEPEHTNNLHMSHHHQFPPNHPLNALNNFMGMGGLHGMQSLQHNDVLEKLKMQVRDMKVGLMDQEYAAAHVNAFGANILPTPINTAFTLPPTSMASLSHAAQTLAAQTGNNINTHLSVNSSTASSVAAVPSSIGSHNTNPSFSFTSPTAPNTKDANPPSNSSTSSEASNSSQHNNGWSFEEQYKQVRQLYEINDDPKRKEFLDDLFSFMQKRGTPINRLPIMAKSVLDLYELYNLVIARGGLVDVINKKLWQEIIKGLHLPSSITSAAFTLRTQYMKYLYPYECEKKNLSSPAELQAAIDGNRREGRRSSYGQYEAMHNQMQMPALARQSMSSSLQQMSPLALVTHAAAANNQQAQAAAAAAAAHHRLIAPNFGQMPNLVTQEIEQRMIEYLKLIQVKKEQNALANSTNAMSLSPHHQHQHHQQHQQPQQNRQRSQSPELSPREALNALEMSRVALWQMYHNNTSPPASVNVSPQGSSVTGSGGNVCSGLETQRSEALNLSDSPPSVAAIKRERELEPCPEIIGNGDFNNQPPPPKRVGFPSSFYLTPGSMAAAAVNFHYKEKEEHHESDGDDDHDAEDGHNITANSSHDDPMDRHQLNGVNARQSHHDSDSSVHIDKSDDSAIENSPSTSAVSASNGNISPVSTKKIHISKQHYVQLQSNNAKGCESGTSSKSTSNSPLGTLETLNLLSGMQFRVTRNGTTSNGEQQLSVNLELNGIRYSGVLIANNSNQIVKDTQSIVTCPSNTSIPIRSNEDNHISFCSRSENITTSSISHGNEELKDVDAASAVISIDKEQNVCENDSMETKHSLNNIDIANGAIPTTLKDSLITS